MQEYKNKADLINEIITTAEQFINEFEDIDNSLKNFLFPEVDKSPQQMIAYQLGWMKQLRKWDSDELEGKEVITPADNYKWNQLGGLYQEFYAFYQEESIAELCELFKKMVKSYCAWIEGFTEEQLFKSSGRKWTASTPSNWPLWKWLHINTVAPFKSFKAKIRKWKKLLLLSR